MNWLAIGKRCPKKDGRACLCIPSSPALFTTLEVCVRLMLKIYMGMGLPADSNNCCLCTRNSSKPNPSAFAQAQVPPPALSAWLREALQKSPPAENRRIRAHLPACLQEWMWVSRVYPGLSVEHGIYS